MTPSHSTPTTSDTNSQKLAGKIAIVTGGSKGIGLAIARSLGEMGAKVSICARDKSKLNQAAEELRKAGFDVLAVPADVTRPKDIATLVETTDKSSAPSTF